jgi:hypothetical protein
MLSLTCDCIVVSKEVRMHKVLHTGPAIPLRYVGIDLILPLGNGSSRKGGAGNIGISSSRWTTIVGKARRESSQKIILLL